MNAGRAVIGVFAVASQLVAPPASADPVFGLSFALAEGTVDHAWVEAQIDEANRLFGPLGTTFRWTLEKPLAEGHAALHSRAERDALTALTERGSVIDVFVVRELEDVDEPGRMRMGVCWTGLGKKRFLVVSRIARPSVLAHELGHFFGNPHSTVPDNLMSYSRATGNVFLDDRQSAIIRSFTTNFLATGRLLDVGPPRRLP